MNNINSILISIHQNHLMPLTIILPLSSCLTRFIAGILSDLFIHKMSRASWQLFAAILLFISQLMMAIDIKHTILATGVIVGIATGMLWCITVTICFFLIFSRRLSVKCLVFPILGKTGGGHSLDLESLGFYCRY